MAHGDQPGQGPTEGAAPDGGVLRYPRILLKLSGEALAGDTKFGFDFERLSFFAGQIEEVFRAGVEIGLVIGGGNIVRGAQLSKMGMERVGADYMGMLGTVINALALQDALEKRGLDTRVMTAIRMEELAEPYIRRRALRHLEQHRIVIFAAGTGNPYFSTDTAAVLRAIQIKADVIIKATSVDGVYTADPKQDPGARRYEEISYRDVMVEELRVMDQTAVTLSRENALPLIVLNAHRPGSVLRACRGEREGTLVSDAATAPAQPASNDPQHPRTAMATIKDLIQSGRTAMEKGVESAKRDFATVRAGKASPNMLDAVRVDAYGSLLPLNQVASVAAPEPRLLLVTPFDKGQAKVIEKAIRDSDLGVEPSNMGGVIRVPLPSLNEQRRKELVKVAHGYAEAGRVAVRHARTDARDKIKKLEGVSEDEKTRAEKDLQKLHDEHIQKVEALLKAKEAEIMAV